MLLKLLNDYLRSVERWLQQLQTSSSNASAMGDSCSWPELAVPGLVGWPSVH